ncbi:MAG: methyltransferase domain-containing protein [Dehalococcoidia bacterium]|nr:methyltransferase domain-containing protein [Dehalococcoidia bacterium]
MLSSRRRQLGDRSPPPPTRTSIRCVASSLTSASPPWEGCISSPDDRQAHGLNTSWVRGKRFLDVGCGGGEYGVILAFLEASRIVLVDRDPQQLGQARRALRRLQRAEFVRSDGVALPFPDSSFDGVLCLRVLHHAREPRLITTELSRVLAPHGQIFLTEHRHETRIAE